MECHFTRQIARDTPDQASYARCGQVLQIRTRFFVRYLAVAIFPNWLPNHLDIASNDCVLSPNEGVEIPMPCSIESSKLLSLASELAGRVQMR